MKLFNYIIILTFICNYIFIYLGIKSLIFIWALLLCIFFILVFKQNLEKFNYKNIGHVLIIFKKIINLISLLTFFFNFSPNWIYYIDYVVEVGLEDDENVNKAVNELGLTENQKYYLKIGCMITAVVLSVIFGYYIINNYEIFKPVDNDLKDFKQINGDKLVDNIDHAFKSNQEKPINDDNLVDSILDDVFKDNQEKLINDDLSDDDLFIDIDVKKIALNVRNEHLLLNNLNNKEYHDSIKIEEIWETLEHFRTNHPSVIEVPLVEEITSENIKYYEAFMHHYHAYLGYLHDEKNSVISSEYTTLVGNMVDAYCLIPEVAKNIKKI